MLFSPVYAKLHHRPDPYPAPHGQRASSSTSVQPLCLQSLTDSPTQRAKRISFSFNRLRTISTPTEGVPPLFPLWNSSPSLEHSHLSSFFSCTYRNPILQPRSFDIHTKCPGVYPLAVHTCRRLKMFPNYPIYFHILAHSFALTKNSTLLFSSASALFPENHPGWGYPPFPALDRSRGLSRSEPVTNQQSPLRSHCSRRPLVQQSAKAREFFTIRGNNSAPPGV
jgi:hypothetical protein